ncbi:Hypothetical protein CAP_3918 [Chondromyces apiculatus DSM 436]|uniref:Tetratricopeptide repeat protein n=1 Tax=Chondromyces apiculatus DSM 436 TaxID=1192034 RepID=A0A017TGL1_9BACT|nr:Hypothetical protein CAP_3918 [Chondromyces apiculatus DSM 436]
MASAKATRPARHDPDLDLTPTACGREDVANGAGTRKCVLLGRDALVARITGPLVLVVPAARAAELSEAWRLLGDAALDHDALDEAAQAAREATRLAGEAVSSIHLARALHLEGEVAMRRGDVEAAWLAYGRALGLHRETHDRQGEARCLHAVADLATPRLDGRRRASACRGAGGCMARTRRADVAVPRPR